MSNWAALRATLGGSRDDRRTIVRNDADADDARRGDSATTKTKKKRKKRNGDTVGKSEETVTAEDARGAPRRRPDDAVRGDRVAVMLDVDFRPGLLDDGATTFVGDADAERAALARLASTSESGGGGIDDALSIARVEAARLRFVTHMCMHFERACGQRIGKRWCSSYEEWIATACETVLIPTSERSRAALAEKLAKYGADAAEIEEACETMMTKSRELARNLVRERSHRPAGSSERVRLKRENDASVALTLGSTSVRVNAEHFHKLRRLYERCHGAETVDEDAFLTATFAMVCRYDAAQGGQVRFAGGHHTALHGEAFDVLRDGLGCGMELFASPLNCRWPKFCSAHGDVDAPFGSVGSYDGFAPKRGCYEVNPPFEPALVLDVAKHLDSRLAEADALNESLTFIVVTPNWPNRPCWEALRNSPFCRRVEVIPLREHGYYEGAQHRKKSKYRLSSCDSSLIFLQSSRATPVTDDVVGRLRRAFAPKQGAKKK
jgi:phosphorylated CTD-interacting factor 1